MLKVYFYLTIQNLHTKKKYKERPIKQAIVGKLCFFVFFGIFCLQYLLSELKKSVRKEKVYKKFKNLKNSDFCGIF